MQVPQIEHARFLDNFHDPGDLEEAVLDNVHVHDSHKTETLNPNFHQNE